ncbi:acyl-CoA dehydrogenase family protein [Sphingobacterium sp. SGR-19]|uniref:acyl-CoA dehydrogenase family protein n=1 Tax=Sphingobacterium sp. SGR-19 TaxID=2710886 RepID=UPI0013EDB6FA|nr:acyl-CoA dehydrogenase family protein [Sphingobacterium sp. SGR-19]NGM66923.1 acyl-CoA/acyl-ACP dehydrogenase [Sphingobacterium sp. SGR-19]
MNAVREQIDFSTYISAFRKHLKHLFREEFDYNAMSLHRDFPADFLSEIMKKKPLAVAIPTAHGGRGVSVKECLSVLSAASYESLALSLMFGINIALFLEPLAKYGNYSVQERVFKQFIENNAMGGLMITEKAYGSDALNMKTAYRQVDNTYYIKGQKHWQGLSGAADFWLVTARAVNASGDLARDIDFFVTDNNMPEQHIPMVHRYNNLGLYAIPYGINEVDIVVPAEQKLVAESTGIKLMLDMLHRSRLQFPGMGMGFIKRLLDESLQHCQTRIVGGVPLLNLDSVKHQITKIQAAYTICSGMCAFSVGQSGIEHNLAALSIEANTLKALVTDLMQESAQVSLQLAGANGFRLDHVAGRAIVDSRPFQVFEGSNEMLYAQIAEGILKLMRKVKEDNVLGFLTTYNRTNISVDFFRTYLDFRIHGVMKQRDLVTLGSMIARVISFQFVLMLDGFNTQLVEITRQYICRDLAASHGHLHSKNDVNPVLDYETHSDWTAFLV